MVWDGISHGGSTDLIFIQNGNLNGLRYFNKILQPIVLTYGGTIGQISIFMDDNSRTHERRIVGDWLDRERMNWPANLPDRSPSEHAWDALEYNSDLRFRLTIPELQFSLRE